MLNEVFANIRTKRPLIHAITNYVAANDCANILLACGGSPIMSGDEYEVEDVTSICDGLCVNIGTLDHRAVPAMLKAGKKANELGHPAVLDPVGAGSSGHRSETALRLINEIRFDVIRGNISEIRALALGSAASHGVDAVWTDRVRNENLGEAVALIKGFARAHHTVAAVTGAIDIVTDGEKAYCIYNGHPMMAMVTGAGCQLSVLTAACIAANPGNCLEAAAAAVCAMGLCGEKAYARLRPEDGNASYRNYIIDAVFRLTPEDLEKGANYEVR